MTCSCLSCLRSRFVSLHDIAPRLARARDQLIEERRLARKEREHLRREVLRAQWRVDHRDLQLVRAASTNDGGYIRRRQRLLKAAKAELAYYKRRAAEAERTAA
jgi:hypothetical protein